MKVRDRWDYRIVGRPRQMLSRNSGKTILKQSIKIVIAWKDRLLLKLIIMEKKQKNLTWQDLKNFANSLSEEQLTQEFIGWGDEFGVTIEEIIPLETDYVNPYGEGYASINDYQDPDATPEENEEILQEAKDMGCYLPAGTLIAFVDRRRPHLEAQGYKGAIKIVKRLADWSKKTEVVMDLELQGIELASVKFIEKYDRYNNLNIEI